MLFGLENKYLEKNYSIASEAYTDDFFSIERARKLMDIGEFGADTKEYILSFLNEADDDAKRFAYLFYYLQFLGDDDFTFDIWELDTIPMPDVWEQKYPGAIKSVVYLFAYDHFAEVAERLSLPESCLAGYFNRYRYYVELNLISHKLPSLCRLSPFLYAMATGRLLTIGRLSFQLKKLFDYANIYEYPDGRRIFAALPNYCYGDDGLQADEGFVPSFEDRGDSVYAHVFDSDGRLSSNRHIIDISDCTKIYKPGDLCITVHIPEGGKLTQDLVKKSINDAWTVFKSLYPDLKCIICQTWFIDPNIRSCLSKGGNLEAFADMFDVISATDNRYHSLYEHIFKTERCLVSDLKPSNSFQQRVLDYVMSGNRMFWGFGLLKNGIQGDVIHE